MNLDYVYRVPHFVAPGETLAASSQAVNPGGKGLNQSIALARAGAAVWHAGCIGEGGQPLAELLRQNGVDVSLVRQADCVQGNAVVQVNDAGENCILLYGGSNRAVTPAQVEETLARFAPGDILVLQNEISCLDLLVERAAGMGLRIVLNPSPFEEPLLRLDYSAIFFLAALAQGYPLTECMRRAAMASAIGVSRPGASGSIPTAAEMEQALRGLEGEV